MPPRRPNGIDESGKQIVHDTNRRIDGVENWAREKMDEVIFSNDERVAAENPIAGGVNGGPRAPQPAKATSVFHRLGAYDGFGL